jgi:hypothetical protein
MRETYLDAGDELLNLVAQRLKVGFQFLDVLRCSHRIQPVCVCVCVCVCVSIYCMYIRLHACSIHTYVSIYCLYVCMYVCLY